MAIHLISGVPGAGKTLRAVHTVLGLMGEEDGQDRPVFGNVNGFRHQADIPDQWMDCPDGSIVLIDECQQRWRRYRTTGEPPAEIMALEKHRHRGIDFILTCQNPAQLSGDVRALVDTHEHLMIQVRHKAASVYKFMGNCHTNPSARKKDADCEVSVWRYPQEVFAAYTSSVQHTGKSRLPAFVRRLLWALLFVVIAGSIAAYRMFDMFTNGSESVRSVTGGAATSSSAGGVAQANSLIEADPVLVVAAIKGADEKICRAYDKSALQVPMTLNDCLTLSENYLPAFYRP